ncbi:MAG: hypothetical protein ACK50L_00300 [Bacteroidota bacterium]
MCLTLYIATNKVMLTIPYDENNRSFNTEDIVDSEKSIKNILTLPNVKLLGSDQGCGCGFRHAMYDDNRWLDVLDDDETPFDNSNHEKLVDFIIKNNKDEKSVELFALWAGDIYPAEHRETIKLNDILDPDFYFKERGLYTVEI